jgi:hypothetical protein
MIIFQRETRFRLRRHLVVTSLARFSILKRIELVPFLSHVCVAEMCADETVRAAWFHESNTAIKSTPC